MVIEARSIRVTLGKRQIVSGVSCVVGAGECLGLIGPNGSGKSSFFNALSGFYEISGGSLLLNGENLTTASAAERAQKGIGRVFQNSGVFRDMTLLENMLVALEARHGLRRSFFSLSSRRELRDEAATLLNGVGLVDSLNRRAGDLSGGQLRLLEIQRMVARGASIILLDEPTAGVSPKMKGTLRDAIQGLVNSGKGVLVIEHDIAFIRDLCPRIIVLDAGSVVLEGESSYVQNHPLLKEIYLGVS
jgi:ABC-type branched-subunit amino acid transport system ATPase component